jgi:phage terminase large subunit-like protein
MVEAGRVYLPECAEWLSDFLEEISSFPSAPHDNQTDALTKALNFVRGSFSGIRDFMHDMSDAIDRGEDAL